MKTLTGSLLIFLCFLLYSCLWSWTWTWM